MKQNVIFFYVQCSFDNKHYNSYLPKLFFYQIRHNEQTFNTETLFRVFEKFKTVI